MSESEWLKARAKKSDLAYIDFLKRENGVLKAENITLRT